MHRACCPSSKIAASSSTSGTTLVCRCQPAKSRLAWPHWLVVHLHQLVLGLVFVAMAVVVTWQIHFKYSAAAILCVTTISKLFTATARMNGLSATTVPALQ